MVDGYCTVGDGRLHLLCNALMGGLSYTATHTVCASQHHVMEWQTRLSYLLSIGTSQHVAAHDVDEVGLRVQFTHQSAQSTPEPGQKTGNSWQLAGNWAMHP